MAITYNEWTTVKEIYRYDSAAATYSSNLRDETAFDYFGDSAVVGDCLYFANGDKLSPETNTYNGVWKDIKFYVGTALAATSITLAWEYWNGSAWTALSSVVDNTNSFQNTGENSLTFDCPEDWYLLRLYPPNTHYLWWIRARITAVSGLTEGGAQSTQLVQIGTNGIHLSTYTDVNNPVTLADIYAENVAQGWGMIDRLDAGDGYHYHFHCNLMFDGVDAGTTVYFKTLADILSFADGRRWTSRGGYNHWYDGEEIENGESSCKGSLIIMSKKDATTGGWALWQGWGSFGSTVWRGTHLRYPGATGQGYISFKGDWKDVIVEGDTGQVQFSNNSHTSTIRCSYRRTNKTSFIGATTMEDVEIIKGGLWMYTGTVTDLRLVWSSARIQQPHDLTLIDPTNWDPNWVAFGGGVNPKVWAKYTFTLYVYDTNGNIISGANVVIKDSDDTEVFNDVTDASGKITTQLIYTYQYFIGTTWDYIPGTIEYHTPHTVTITKSGYKKRTFPLTMDRKREEVQKLEKVLDLNLSNSVKLFSQ